ncbi:MAG: GAF domain-containing sensor histidine kinase [Chloroflexota bacterium]
MTTENTVTNTQLLERYERIIAISQKLNTTFDLRSLLGTIIKAAQELTNVEAASIMLIDPSSGELRFEAASNIKAHEMDRITVPMEGSIAGWIATHGEPRVINDASKTPEFYDDVDKEIAFKTRDLLGVPMRAHDKVIGVLEAINKVDGSAYTSEDIETLNTLAGQAAIAIENARLFQQSDFIAEMVHEIRTPLAALKASTVLLQRPELPQEKHKDIIDTMHGETERLIRMTSEFLDLARLESGRFQLEKAPFDLERLIRESMDVVIHQASAKDVTFHLNVHDYTITGDRGKYKQVILNLFTNAIKYNRDGGHVYVRTREVVENDSSFVEVTVEDTGFGISPENMKNLFTKFFRVADTAGHTQGTGLGLAITRHIAEAHGGNVWAKSEHGKGSTFFVTMPVSG